MQQRALARAALAHDGHHLAGRHVEVEVLEHVQAAGGGVVALAHATRAQDDGRALGQDGGGGEGEIVGHRVGFRVPACRVPRAVERKCAMSR